MRILLLITGILFSQYLIAQTIQRLQEEPLLDFVSRVGPDSSDIMPRITMETEWDGMPVIVAFYKKEIDKVTHTLQGEVDHNRYQTITGYVFRRVSELNYKAVILNPIFPNGGGAEIVSVFFANADADSILELAILIKWDQRHYDYNGTFYETQFFSRPNTFNLQTLLYSKHLSDKFYGCDCWYREDDRTEVAKFKTENDVREELVRLGFKR